MSNVYSIGNNRQLIIYPAGSNIFLRIAYYGGIDRPVVLAADYLSGLNECMYNGILYYSYISMDNSLVVKNIMESNNIYAISGNEMPELYSPAICPCNQALLLFYLKNNPLTKHTSLHCVALCDTDNNNLPVPLPSCVNNISSYQVYDCGRGIILCVDNKTFIIEEIGHIKELTSQSDVKAAISSDYENKLSSLNVKYNSDIQKLIEQNNKKIAACQAKIDEQAAVINSITSQYNELMTVAQKYRDEALMWRSKFM